jgi:DNA-binding winged helix-turn-helix (wHTH) protein/predicted ATPase
MTTDGQIAFGVFRFDARTGELWCDGTRAKLTPRAAAVFAMLAERAEKLVTKQELFDQIWSGLAVSDDALTSCIQELRHALGDDARHPRFIETRHRRGYRLMLPVTPAGEVVRLAGAPRAHSPGAVGLVGRDAEKDELEKRFGLTLARQRQIVFVTGEPGIGKSALVGAFIDRLDRGAVRIAQGQCLDHHGVGEPYMPLIEAFGRLGVSADGARIRTILATHAPSWLAQMPSLWTRSQRSALEARGRATRERMLRELTSAVEVIAADAPLVLTLEDIHWSDASTLDWLAYVARRPEPAPLIVLATFRPADAAAISAGLAGLTAELALHGRCYEIALNPLNVQAVEAYLAARLGEADRLSHPREIARLLLERTGGNPLFMVSIVNQLALQPSGTVTRDAITETPRDVRRFIDRQIDDLDDSDRELLSGASVIRREFSTAAVAAALERDIDVVETACARLARQGVFIVKMGAGTWPDGTPAELYAFRHDLYRELLYDRLPATRCAISHARVGRRLETAWTGRLDTIAAELAEHFERGNELARSIPHHQRAAAQALRRSANQEAIGHLQRALGAIGHIADEEERTKIEVELRVGIGAAFMAVGGFGAPEVLAAHARAETLCDRLGERPDLFPALWGQWMFHTGRGDTRAASRLCARLLALADKFGDAALKIQAHHAMWSTSFVRGELAKAHGHARCGLALFDPQTHRAMASSYGNHDAACCARNFSAMALALAGDGDGARAIIDQALVAAKTLDDPFSLALTLYFTSAAAQMLGDLPLATANSELSVRMATEHDLAQPKAWSMGVAGWCIAESGDPSRGIALVTQAIAVMDAIESRHFLCYLHGLLADACAKAGHSAEAMKAIENGLAVAEETGERFYSAELHRLRGELLACPPHRQKREAHASFRIAIELSKGQGATALERKAMESLRRSQDSAIT